MPRLFHIMPVPRREALPSSRLVLSVPSGACLRAVAASLPELWRTRSHLGQVEGFDLTPANRTLGVVGGEEGPSGGASEAGTEGAAASGKEGAPQQQQQQQQQRKRQHHGCLPVLPYPVWQCGGGYQELSQRATVMKFDFAAAMAVQTGSAELHWGSFPPPADKNGESMSPAPVGPDCHAPSRAAVSPAPDGPVCHAVVFWMDYKLGGSSSGEPLWLSQMPDPQGRPLPSVQGVLLLQQPVAAGGPGLMVRASLSSEDGDISFEVVTSEE